MLVQPVGVDSCMCPDHYLQHALQQGEVAVLSSSSSTGRSIYYLKIKLIDNTIEQSEAVRDSALRAKFESIILKIDSLRETLKLFQLPIDIYLKEIDVSHTDISGDLFVGLYSHNPTSSIFLEIETLNLSRTRIKSSDLHNLHLLKNLKEIKLDHCNELHLFGSPEKTVCPSVKTISLIGSKLTKDSEWLQNIEIKFPNVTCIDFSQNDGGRFCGVSDTVSLEDIKFPQVYSPCGHIANISRRVDDWAKKQCYKCYQPIEEYFHAKFPFSRLKKLGDRWTITLLDFNGQEILENDNPKLNPIKRQDFVYFHPPCHQLFTAKTASELLESQSLKIETTQDILKQGPRISCPACPDDKSFKLMRVYLNLTSERHREKFVSLREFQQHRFQSHYESM